MKKTYFNFWPILVLGFLLGLAIATSQKVNKQSSAHEPTEIDTNADHQTDSKVKFEIKL